MANFMTRSETALYAKKFVEGAKAGENVGFEACLLNVSGDPELMMELFKIGFRECLLAALPPNQHGIGHVSK